MSDLMMLAAAAAQAAAQAPVAEATSPLLAYVSPVFLLLWAAALCLVAAVIHSVLGEQKLLRPQLAAPTGVMENPLARQVTRLAWHWTSALWLLVGGLLAAAAYGDITASWLVIAVGAVHLIAGIADAVITKGRHIGWPLIVLIGALTLFSAYLTL
jgi:hypothetical protein